MKDREQALSQTHRIGVAANAGLAAMKLTIGSLAGSRALVADGVHSLSDVVMNVGAWIGWRWSSRPADSDHHYGHGNGEALTGTIVGLIIVAAGGGLIWTALRGTSTVTADALGAAAIAAELVTIGVKLGLTRMTKRRGTEFDSPILLALARDNLGDVLTSALIMLAILGSMFGLRWLEPVAACAIGLLIAWQGIRSAYEGIDVLMDRAPDHELTAKIREVAGSVAGVHAIDRVRVHPLGTHLHAELEISVDGTVTVADGHAIAHAVSDSVARECPRVEDVSVHVNPN
jgi:cation diffusion facilitator family transporter